MSRSRASSWAEKAATASLWGCELNQDERTWTFRSQCQGKQDCQLVLHTICLGEKAKEEMNLVDIVPGSREDRKAKPITIASLQPSVLPTVVMPELVLSPPITFQLRAGSGPVFISGLERYDTEDRSWQEEEQEEEEEGDEGEEEEEEEDEEEDEDIEVSLDSSPVKRTKRPATQKQLSVAKKKKMDSDEEASRSKDKSPVKKIKALLKSKKVGSKK